MNPTGAEVDLRVLQELFRLLAIIVGIFGALTLACVAALVATEWSRPGFPACPGRRKNRQALPIKTMPIPDNPIVASKHRIVTLVAR